VETEIRVDRFEIDIDSDCSHIIVRRQPAATDLRLIMAVTKTVTDLERIGDEAHKIARMAKQIHERSVTDLSRFANLRHTGDTAVNMLRQALDAFARLDEKVAEKIIMEDRIIDFEFKATVRQLITFMMEDPRTISTALDIIWIAKAVERIGDHAKNICEDVIYIVRGTDIRHKQLDAPSAEAVPANA
ncbi:MAG: phosphate signaling complex protein PhoU, partial [Burkholderiales bacterium]